MLYIRVQLSQDTVVKELVDIILLYKLLPPILSFHTHNHKVLFSPYCIQTAELDQSQTSLPEKIKTYIYINKTSLAFITIRYPREQFQCCNLHQRTQMKTGPDVEPKPKLLLSHHCSQQNYREDTAVPFPLPFFSQQSYRSAQVQ